MIRTASMSRSCKLDFRNRADGSSYNVPTRLRAGQTATDLKQLAEGIAGGTVASYYTGDELTTEIGFDLLADSWRAKCTEEDLELDRGSYNDEGEELTLHIAV